MSHRTMEPAQAFSHAAQAGDAAERAAAAAALVAVAPAWGHLVEASLVGLASPYRHIKALSLNVAEDLSYAAHVAYDGQAIAPIARAREAAGEIRKLLGMPPVPAPTGGRW